MRVAVVHDWLTGMRGGERVLETILEVFPDADLYTLVHVPGSVSARIEARPIHTSFLDHLPGARTRYRSFLPLFPAAISLLRIREADLVVSVSTCAAKAIQPPAGVPHICYCNTPMRYVWDRYADYLGAGRAPLPIRLVAPQVARWLRRWDVESSRRVSRFVANSEHVRGRIRRFYGRDSQVVYPPVALERFHPAERRDAFYLVLGALVPYKRVDLAVAAFRRLGRPLVVAGDGPELARLMSHAGPNVEFRGRVDDETAADLLGRCRALILPGLEDFGITPVEAQAAGAPVIAFGAGGVLETVFPAGHSWAGWPYGPTGVFFPEQTVESLAAAVEEFELLSFDPTGLRASAERFAPVAFRSGMMATVAGVVGLQPSMAAGGERCASRR